MSDHYEDMLRSLKDRIRELDYEMDEAKREQRRTIFHAHREGKSVGEIMECTELSESEVRRIIGSMRNSLAYIYSMGWSYERISEMAEIPYAELNAIIEEYKHDFD